MSMYTFHLNDTEYDLIAQEVLGKADPDEAKENCFIYIFVIKRAEWWWQAYTYEHYRRDWSRLCPEVVVGLKWTALWLNWLDVAAHFLTGG
ncbi:TPA: hypothetical protein ACH3X1_009065 [Trebouxia sp. C0004]